MTERMANKDKFIMYAERNILMDGEDAEPKIYIKGNETELRKLVKMITEAIGYAHEDKNGYSWSDDEIDQQYVCIEAYIDGKKIKPDAPTYNPFENTWVH